MLSYSDERTKELIASGTRVSLLDEQRKASMADEGGMSGALMDLDDDAERKRLQDSLRKRRLFTWSRVAVAGAFLATVALVMGLRRSWR
jgi:hypothetical protein